MSELATPPDAVEELERIMLTPDGMASLGMVKIECPLVHQFAPGVYLRTIKMPAGARIIGQRHLTEHFNIVHTGRALVLIDGEPHEVVAPCIFVSKAGVRKVLQIEEEMTWSTVHVNPDDETDIAKLEERYIVKSPAFLEHEKEDAQKLDQFMNTPSIETGGNP